MNKATLFVDESGKASLIDCKDDPFLLTGIILDNNEGQVIEGFFKYIKLKFGIPQDKSFHSYDVFENPKTKLNNSDLTDLSKSIAEFISLIPIKIHVAQVSKSQFRDALGAKSLEDFSGSSERKEMRDYPYRVTAAYIFAMFGEYLAKEDVIGQIVADSRKGGDHQLLKTLDLCKEKAFPITDKYYVAIRDRVTAICFAEKGFLSGGLEIADIISFTSFNHALRKMTGFAQFGLDRIWNQVREKSEFETINKSTIRSFFRLKRGEVHKYLKQGS